jgi:hypothetical protein
MEFTKSNIEQEHLKFIIDPEVFIDKINGPFKDQYQDKFREIIIQLDDLKLIQRTQSPPYRKIVELFGEVFPIVDVKLNIIFASKHNKKHIDITALLYAYQNQENPTDIEDLMTVIYADSFIDDKQGYYLTSIPFLSGGGGL